MLQITIKSPDSDKVINADAWYTNSFFKGITFDVEPAFDNANKNFRLLDTKFNRDTMMIMGDHLSNRARMLIRCGSIDNLHIEEAYAKIKSGNNGVMAKLLLRKEVV